MVGTDGEGEVGGGEVLVDDRLHTVQLPVRVAHDGDTATPAADDHGPTVQQLRGDGLLEDAHWHRGGHDPAPLRAVLRDGPTVLDGEPSGFVL